MKAGSSQNSSWSSLTEEMFGGQHLNNEKDIGPKLTVNTTAISTKTARGKSQIGEHADLYAKTHKPTFDRAELVRDKSFACRSFGKYPGCPAVAPKSQSFALSMAPLVRLGARSFSQFGSCPHPFPAKTYQQHPEPRSMTYGYSNRFPKFRGLQH